MGDCSLTIQTDVLVVGAGPAGAAFARKLARTHNVMIVDRRQAADQQIGESLVPGVQGRMTELGLWPSFLEQHHPKATLGQSVWGGTEPMPDDGPHALDGPAWQVDRARFGDWLREMAVQLC